jgi:hypothetical protein
VRRPLYYESIHYSERFHYLAKRDFPELSNKELDRLRAIRLNRQTADEQLVCGTFGISRATLYPWIKRYDPRNPYFSQGSFEATPLGAKTSVVP